MQQFCVKFAEMEDGFALEDFLPFRLNRLAVEVSERLSKLYASRFDLDIAQWRVLATLAGEGEATARAIVRSTRTHKSTISRAVRQLEEKRLIERAILKNDKRAHVLRLAPKGRRLFGQIEPLVLDYQKVLLARITPRERDALLKGVAALEAALDLKGNEP